MSRCVFVPYVSESYYDEITTRIIGVYTSKTKAVQDLATTLLEEYTDNDFVQVFSGASVGAINSMGKDKWEELQKEISKCDDVLEVQRIIACYKIADKEWDMFMYKEIKCLNTQTQLTRFVYKYIIPILPDGPRMWKIDQIEIIGKTKREKILESNLSHLTKEAYYQALKHIGDVFPDVVSKIISDYL